jgi:hypothetical protein
VGLSDFLRAADCRAVLSFNIEQLDLTIGADKLVTIGGERIVDLRQTVDFVDTVS